MNTKWFFDNLPSVNVFRERIRRFVYLFLCALVQRLHFLHFPLCHTFGILASLPSPNLFSGRRKPVNILTRWLRYRPVRYERLCRNWKRVWICAYLTFTAVKRLLARYWGRFLHNFFRMWCLYSVSGLSLLAIPKLCLICFPFSLLVLFTKHFAFETYALFPWMNGKCLDLYRPYGIFCTLKRPKRSRWPGFIFWRIQLLSG